MLEERPRHDEDLSRIIGRIRANKEEKELVLILSGVKVRWEYQKISKFIVVLKTFQGPGRQSRRLQYALGPAILAILSSEARNFVL